MDLIKIKEYLFNTAEYSGENKNIEEWYLKQTINFINECEGKNSETSDENLNIADVSNNEVAVCRHGYYHVEELPVIICTDCGEVLGRQTDC